MILSTSAVTRTRGDPKPTFLRSTSTPVTLNLLKQIVDDSFLVTSNSVHRFKNGRDSFASFITPTLTAIVHLRKSGFEAPIHQPWDLITPILVSLATRIVEDGVILHRPALFAARFAVKVLNSLGYNPKIEFGDTDLIHALELEIAPFELLASGRIETVDQSKIHEQCLAFIAEFFAEPA